MSNLADIVKIENTIKKSSKIIFVLTIRYLKKIDEFYQYLDDNGIYIDPEEQYHNKFQSREVTEFVYSISETTFVNYCSIGLIIRNPNIGEGDNDLAVDIFDNIIRIINATKVVIIPRNDDSSSLTDEEVVNDYLIKSEIYTDNNNFHPSYLDVVKLRELRINQLGHLKDRKVDELNRVKNQYKNTGIGYDKVELLQQVVNQSNEELRLLRTDVRLTKEDEGVGDIVIMKYR